MSASADHTFDIKSARLNLFSIRLRSTRLADITRDLDNRFSADSPFSRTPAMLDVSQVNPVELDYRGLVARFAQYGIHLVGVRPTPASLEGALDDAGLLPLGGDEALDESRLEDEPQPQTLVIDKPVRAGQQVYARGGNLVVLATVSAGAEVIADGDIHIYGSLRGRALAGARGQRDARIFVRSMQAELLSIAGIWRTLEQDLPAALASRPLQVLLESDKIVMRALPD